MADRPGEAHELLTDLRLMGETPTHYGQEEHGEVHLEALARVAQLEEALRAAEKALRLECRDAWAYSSCSQARAAAYETRAIVRAVLAGVDPARQPGGDA